MPCRGRVTLPCVCVCGSVALCYDLLCRVVPLLTDGAVQHTSSAVASVVDVATVSVSAGSSTSAADPWSGTVKCNAKFCGKYYHYKCLSGLRYAACNVNILLVECLGFAE